jgi:hypothetical protein
LIAEKRAQNAPLLDLLAEDNRLNVYAGKLEVRPPGAPTTQDGLTAAERRGVLGAPFSHGPVRRSERSGRSEMIWLNSEPP